MLDLRLNGSLHCCCSSIEGGGRSQKLVRVIQDRKVMHSWYDVRTVYCRRLLRINIQCLLLIRPKNMCYLLAVALFLLPQIL